MRLRIELFPLDLDETVAFYVNVLRFVLVRDERSAEWPYVALQRGAVGVGAASRPAVTDLTARRPPVGVELVLEVGDVDGEWERVRRSGWPIEEELHDRPWGLRDFRIVDPSGYYLRITQA
jgi:lactoylglutathione lyase